MSITDLWRLGMPLKKGLTYLHIIGLIFFGVILVTLILITRKKQQTVKVR